MTLCMRATLSTIWGSPVCSGRLAGMSWKCTDSGASEGRQRRRLLYIVSVRKGVSGDMVMHTCTPRGNSSYEQKGSKI